MNVNGLVRFEEYEIDRARWQLRYRNEPLPLSRKTFDLLIHLLEHADRVVSKNELLQALWPDSFVEESNLTQHVFLLRKALSKHASGTRIIETVPGRGYRFAVPIEVEAPADVPVHTLPVPVRDTSTAAGQSVAEVREAATASSVVEIRPASETAVPSAFESQRSPKPTFTSPRRWLLFLAAAGLLLALLYADRSRSQAHPTVLTYTQVTHDGHAKSIGGTDGSRIYFTQLDRQGIAQVSISGGVEAPIPLTIENPWSGDVSPDGSALLIISQAQGQGPGASLWSLNLISGALRELGDAITSAWSPDGNEIVSASVGGDLFLMKDDGSEKHRIASPGGYIECIAWSPDGNTIRFTKDGLLWQVAPDGSKLHQLLPGWGKSSTQWSGRWAADGRFFFAADGQIWQLGGGRWPALEHGLHPVQLTFGPTAWDRPAPSPDGSKLFASGRVRRGELVRLDPQSRRFEALLSGISAEFVNYSRDRGSVAYVLYPEGSLWRANADGSSPVQLTKSPVHPKSVCWSPDGSQIAFVDRTENEVEAIFLVPTNGTGNPRRLLPNDIQPETDPSWSADGHQITFATSPNVGASARSDLRSVDVATGKVTVVPGSEGLLVPRWSPDGRVLAAMTLDTEKLKLLDVASGRWTSFDTGPVAFPQWSHDGHWIYYVRWSAHPALFRFRVADGMREVVTDLGTVRYTGTYTLWMGLDPTDSPMMLRDEGTDDIFALTLGER